MATAVEVDMAARYVKAGCREDVAHAVTAMLAAGSFGLRDAVISVCSESERKSEDLLHERLRIHILQPFLSESAR